MMMVMPGSTVAVATATLPLVTAQPEVTEPTMDPTAMDLRESPVQLEELEETRTGTKRTLRPLARLRRTTVPAILLAVGRPTLARMETPVVAAAMKTVQRTVARTVGRTMELARAALPQEAVATAPANPVEAMERTVLSLVVPPILVRDHPTAVM